MKILHWNTRYGQCSSEENKLMTKKHIPKRQDILRIQYMIQNKTQVETVNQGRSEGGIVGGGGGGGVTPQTFLELT